MAQLIVRRLENEIKERLRARAKRNGRTLEAEARVILEDAARAEPPQSKGLGTLAKELIGESALSREEWKAFEQSLEQARQDWKARDVDFGS